jgi:hypothetical protein
MSDGRTSVGSNDEVTAPDSVEMAGVRVRVHSGADDIPGIDGLQD